MILAALLVPSPVITWKEVRNRLAEHPVEFSRATADPSPRNVLSWFQKAGVRARMDPKTGRQLPGIYYSEWNKPTRVLGEGNGIILTFSSESTSWQRFEGIEELESESGESVWFRQTKDGVKAIALKYPEGFYWLHPGAAFVQKGVLYTLGPSGSGNAPRWALRTYLPSNGGEQVAYAESQDEMAGGGEFVERNEIITVDLDTRTYPRHLDASHATACLSHTERWELRGGFWKRKWRRERSSPYNQLDRMCGELAKGRSVRRFAVDKKVAATLAKLPAGGRVDFPHSRCSIDSPVLSIQGTGVALHYVKRGEEWLVGKVTKADPKVFN